MRNHGFSLQFERTFLIPPYPFKYDQDGKSDEHLENVCRAVQPRYSQKALIENTQDLIPRLSDAVGPEDDPANDDENKGQKHLATFLNVRQEAVLSYCVAVLAVLAHQDKREEEQRMVCAPGNERPVHPVPEPAHKENDKGIADDFCLGAAASTKGDVNIIPEPGCQ